MDAFTLVAKLTMDASGMQAGLNSAEQVLNSADNQGKFTAWGTMVGQLAATAFTKAFSAAGRFARSVLDVGMDFEATMSSVKAVGNLSDEQMTKIEQRAQELGASTKFTAAEVGEAFYYMGLAGWDSEEMLAGIKPVLDLAAASGENLGRVSDIVTDAITAMGLTSEKTAEFVNVLAAASTNSNTTVGMMGEAFKYLATTGGVLEYSIQDVASVLGLLANNGIKASQAGTSMRQILNTLINPSEDAAKAMKALGISLFDPKTDARKPLIQVVQELRDVFKNADFDLGGFTPEQIGEQLAKIDREYAEGLKEIDAETDKTAKKNAQKNLDEWYDAQLTKVLHPNEWFLSKLGDIGGLRGISSLFALMNSTDDDVNQLIEAVNSSNEGEGAASLMSETMIDNLKGDITILNSAMDGLKLLLYGTYKQDLRDFVNTMITEVGRLSEAFNEGGLSGMFINLSDWIINGITDALTDPNVTIDGANQFGEGLGQFVGNLINKLVTNAPEMIDGLFRAGLNLAGGIVEGLFAGLFGTGDNSIYGFLLNAEESRNDMIADAESTSIKAVGIVDYMQSLVDKYGAAATESGEWAKSLETLEGLIPGITDYIKAEGTELGTTTDKMREYIAAHKEKLVQDAKEAYLGDLQQKYLQTQIDLGSAQVNQQIYQNQLAVATETFIEAACARLGDAFTAQAEANMRQSLLAGNFGKSGFNMSWLSEDAESGLEAGTLKGAYQSYLEAVEGLASSTQQISELSDAATTLRERVSIAEQAVQKMAGETEAVETGELQSGIANAAAAANGFANRLNGASVGAGGGEDGSHAAGAWDIPYDNYRAILHRNEMVLTASQARQYRDGTVNSGLTAADVANIARSAVSNLTMEMNNETVGRVFGDSTTRRVNDNIMHMNRRKRYGYGG